MKHDETTSAAVGPSLELVYAYPGIPPRFPYLLMREGTTRWYKVLLRNRYLFISTGDGVLDRGDGELDIPHVGAHRQPAGDFVYDSPALAQAAFDRFRQFPRVTLTEVQSGRKP